jgi:VWFA-related protein
MRCLLAVASVAVFASVALWVGTTGAAAQARSRSVYVTAVDGRGWPVTDPLTAADFAVKEGGKPREVVRAEAATAPLQVAVIVDDNGTGVFRAPVGRFINQLLANGAFAISSVNGQTQKLVDFTRDVGALQEALDRIGPRPRTQDGGQIVEGVSEYAKELHRRKAGRPIILLLTVGGSQYSSLTSGHVLDELKDSGAVMYVVSMAATAIRPSAAPARPSDLIDTVADVTTVVSEGPKQSGGRFDSIGSQGEAGSALLKIAVELQHQYVVSYMLPNGVKPDDRVSVSSKKKGVTLRAPSRIPDT